MKTSPEIRAYLSANGKTGGENGKGDVKKRTTAQCQKAGLASAKARKLAKAATVAVVTLLAAVCCRGQTNVTYLTPTLAGQTVALSGIVSSVDGGGFGGYADKFTVRLAVSNTVVSIPSAALRPGNVCAVIRLGGMGGESCIAIVGARKIGQPVRGGIPIIKPGTRITATGVVKAAGARATMEAVSVVVAK